MIYKTLLLPCSLERAFELFTEEAGRWWPIDRRHTQDLKSVIRIEAGGRFCERASNGTEVELGVVRVFEPPTRVVLDWYPGTGPAEPTHVEIVLSAEGEQTRVQLTHREGAHSADAYAKKAEAFERSWDLVFAAYQNAAGGDSPSVAVLDG